MKISLATRCDTSAPRAKTDSNGVPVVFDKDVDHLDRLICWTGDDRSVDLVRELTAEERSALKARKAALEACLSPHGESDRDVKAVKAALAAMFSGFRSMRQTGQSVDDTIEITRNILREFPAWAISIVCLSVARGDSRLDRHWPPSDAELCDLCRAAVCPRQRQLENARRLLALVSLSVIVVKNPNR